MGDTTRPIGNNHKERDGRARNVQGRRVWEDPFKYKNNVGKVFAYCQSDQQNQNFKNMERKLYTNGARVDNQ
jgi:hypothetical protein